MSEDPDPYHFLTHVAELLGASEPHLRDYGATKSARFSFDGRNVEILQDRDLEIEVGLSLPDYPASVIVSFAPEGLYDRAKMLEEVTPQTHSMTGDQAFDRLFIVVGEHASIVTSRLAATACSALVDAAPLRPSIMPVRFEPGGPPERWLHLRALPILAGPEGGDHGTRDPQLAQAAVRRTLGLAAVLERAWVEG